MPQMLSSLIFGFRLPYIGAYINFLKACFLSGSAIYAYRVSQIPLGHGILRHRLRYQPQLLCHWDYYQDRRRFYTIAACHRKPRSEMKPARHIREQTCRLLLCHGDV